jgi:hypothetical protein
LICKIIAAIHTNGLEGAKVIAYIRFSDSSFRAFGQGNHRDIKNPKNQKLHLTASN